MLTSVLAQGCLHSNAAKHGVSRQTHVRQRYLTWPWVFPAEHAATVELCMVQANWHAGYWVPDMSIQCFTGWHRKLAIILGTPLMTLTWSAQPPGLWPDSL